MENVTTNNNGLIDALLSFIEDQEVNELNINNKTTFVIENMDQANYAAKRVKRLRKEQEEITKTGLDQLKSYEEKVREWIEKSTSSLASTEQYYIKLLEEYAKKQLEGSKKKSLKLIEGTIGFKKQQDKYEYEENVLIDFLEKSHPNYIKKTSSIDKASLKKEGTAKDGMLYFNDTPIPGVTVIPQGETFEVK